MRVRLALAGVGLTACGRVAFDPRDADAARDAPGAACAHLFCDDLDGGAMSPAWGGVETDGAGTVVIDPTFGRTGASIKATGPAGSSRAVRYVDVYPPGAADSWARMMLYVPAAQMLDMEPAEIMDASRTVEYVFSLYDTDVDIHAHGLAGDFNVTQANAVPKGRWTCYELHVAFSTTASGAVELYQDGAAIAQRMIATAPPNGKAMPRLAVGIAAKPTTGSQTIWVDDIAADVTRVGCP